MVCNELNNLVIEKPITLYASLQVNKFADYAFEDPMKLIAYDSHLSSAVTAQFKVKTSC